MKTIIGIILDHEEEGGYSQMPWYAIRENYINPIVTAGGTPILLPHHLECLEDYLEIIDGVLIIGGDFDITPDLYGQKPTRKSQRFKPNRTKFEYQAAERALSRNIPLLGICGGHQLINVVLGGTLIQDIQKENFQPICHEQGPPYHTPGHEIAIKQNTLLHQIFGTERTGVNSSHHQAIEQLGQGLIVNATAPDGIIEGIELPSHSFCLGVQWHPEYVVTPGDQKIFEALVSAATYK